MAGSPSPPGAALQGALDILTVKSKKFLAPGSLVEVDWADAWASDYDDSDHEPLPLRRVGYVIRHNAVGIKVAGQRPLSDQSKHRGIIFIPSFNIVKIHKLK